jgi:hypothetical protein
LESWAFTTAAYRKTVTCRVSVRVRVRVRGRVRAFMKTGMATWKPALVSLPPPPAEESAMPLTESTPVPTTDSMAAAMARRRLAPAVKVSAKGQ